MQTKTILIRGGLVQDAVHREPRKVDLLLAGGKIAAIGENLDATADAEVFDAAGLQVFPGFVDAHTHIGLDGYGIGYEGCDYNEMNDIWTPQLRAIDGINPRDPSLADRVGSLEVGKDADVVITNGCPFEVMTEVRAVFIDGVQVAE